MSMLFKVLSNEGFGFNYFEGAVLLASENKNFKSLNQRNFIAFLSNNLSYRQYLDNVDIVHAS